MRWHRLKPEHSSEWQVRRERGHEDNGRGCEIAKMIAASLGSCRKIDKMAAPMRMRTICGFLFLSIRV
jgi:hypothetical protein